MYYIRRELERKFLEMSKVFKAVMVVGARQVGKSTMLRQLAKNDSRTFITMDDIQLRQFAQSDPVLFLKTYQPPILIDEVQKAPELFEHIKILCDESDEPGLFWLTGSQSTKLMKKAGDSLAGRICILKMYSLSQHELLGVYPEAAIDFSYPALKLRQESFPNISVQEIFEHIWRGGMPLVQSFSSEQMQEYFNSYIETYLMRDAVDDNGISNTEGFRKFLRACAAFSGQLLNYNELALSAGVSGVTAKEWVKVLQSMGIITLIEPYSTNELKRLIRTPKLYFCDTGLCAFLSSWTSRDVLMNGAASGHFFENYVVGEFIRNYAYGKNHVNLNFYRDRNMKEIDLVIEEEGILHPIEIKKGSSPERKLINTFSVLNGNTKPVGNGGIVCLTDRPFPLDENNCLIPSSII